MKSRKRAVRKITVAKSVAKPRKANRKKAKPLALPQESLPAAKKKNPEKLVGRFAQDFAALRNEMLRRSSTTMEVALAPLPGTTLETSTALMRLKALTERDQTLPVSSLLAPVNPSIANWTPLGPLAVPNGQTYGGARVLISGRVTAIAPHPTNGDMIYIGTSRGGVWRTDDAAVTWTPLTDHEPSLAIGALAIAPSDPNILYAGTGEGNLQKYSTAYPLSSAPGVYLGIGVLRSADGGASWTHHAATLLAGHSFYRIAVVASNAHRAFAATSLGLCRTLDGTNWTSVAGGGLPAISATVMACTDVVVDRGDTTGNTIYVAFWGSGIYKSTDALAASPTFTLLSTGLPVGSSTSRISLAQSASSPERKYALVASSGDAFLGLYRTTNAMGTNWELCTSSGVVQLYGAFTSDVNVDPTTPNVVYISGVELYKCQFNTAAGTWTVTNIGGNIHPDSHTFGFHSTLNQTIYSGNDGGFYVSRDGGATWEDAPNEGLCLLQYEAIDNHASSDAVIQGGSQDNGTQQYRNSPVHYHSADGDGGYCTISKINGNNLTHAYYGNSPQRSTSGGKFGSYANVSGGINGGGLFYPPAAISSSSERMIWGTSVINVDDAMGTGGWPGTGVALSGIVGSISAVSFASNNIVYCATTSGQVYRLDRSGTTWSVRTLHAAPLPTGQWIWDIQSLPNDVNSILVVFSGFGLAQHVWRGTVPAAGAAAWAPLSNGLPDVPMYALAFASPTQWFVGTDIGVFRTADAGANWNNFSQGLPNTAIYDLRLRDGGNLLRAASHGRGLWEIRTDLQSQHTVDLFVRDHIMDTGRAPSNSPIPAAWEDLTRQVALNDSCYWWHCADIKTDAPPNWQLPTSSVNYFDFETKLTHESPEKGNQNRVYVQIHNRGPLPAGNVTVKVMTAGASAGLPDLPADFWLAWPNSAGDANWTPVGLPQTISTLEPLRPSVLQWNWTPASAADTHSCMLVVIDSPSDPMPASTKAIFNIAQLVTNEKRVGLKNLHLVNLLPNAATLIRFHLHGSPRWKNSYQLQIPPLVLPDVNLSMLLSKPVSKRLTTATLPKGLKAAKVSAGELGLMSDYWIKGELRSEESWAEIMRTFDMSRSFAVDPRSKFVTLPISIRESARESVMLLFRTGAGSSNAGQATITLSQSTTRGELVGGSTFVVRAARKT